MRNPECEYLNETNKKYDCSEMFNCCDCGGEKCGCSGCWSCNACNSCIDSEF